MKQKSGNKCFTSNHCVDGSCPGAQFDSIWSKCGYNHALDIGLKKITCSKCPYNTYLCSDCIFENSEDCYKYRKENK